MKRPFHALIPIAALRGTSEAVAESTSLTLDQLPFETVYKVAEHGILARDADGNPLVVLLKLDKGDFLPPHGEQGGTRLLTVMSGEHSWGDGNDVNQEAEHLYGPGTFLVLPAKGGDHWAAGRSGDVLLQIVFVRNGTLMPEAAAQLK